MDTSTVFGLIALAFAAGYFVGKGRLAAKPSAPPTPPDLKALEAVRPILAGEGKIAAIKAYRERTGTGLRDAKLAVDTLDSDVA